MKIFLIGIIFFTSITWSSPFREKSFKYRKKVSSIYQLTSNEFAKMILDEEILSNSYMDDIRLVWKNQLIPFVIRTVQKETKQGSGSKVPIVSNREVLQTKLLYTLRLPDLPQGTVYSSLEIDAPGNFEAEVALMGQIFPEEVVPRSFQKIYRLDESLETGIKKQIDFLKPDRYAFAKVEIQGPKLEYQFPRVNYIPVIYAKEISRKILLDAIESKNDEDKTSFVYYIPNPNKIPFSKLRVDFSEKIFNRHFTIYEFNPIDKEYIFFQDGNIERTKGNKEPIEISFTRETRNPLKLEIHYADNPPLNLNLLELIYAQQELIFEVTEELLQNFDSLYLYYGNPYTTAPSFDSNSISSLQNETKKGVYISSEKQEPNPNFGYSLTEPPLSIWIMRILFYIGLVVFTFLGYKVLKKYGSPLTPDA